MTLRVIGNAENLGTVSIFADGTDIYDLAYYDNKVYAAVRDHTTPGRLVDNDIGIFQIFDFTTNARTNIRHSRATLPRKALPYRDNVIVGVTLAVIEGTVDNFMVYVGYIRQGMTAAELALNAGIFAVSTLTGFTAHTWPAAFMRTNLWARIRALIGPTGAPGVPPPSIAWINIRQARLMWTIRGIQASGRFSQALGIAGAAGHVTLQTREAINAVAALASLLDALEAELEYRYVEIPANLASPSNYSTASALSGWSNEQIPIVGATGESDNTWYRGAYGLFQDHLPGNYTRLRDTYRAAVSALNAVDWNPAETALQDAVLQAGALYLQRFNQLVSGDVYNTGTIRDTKLKDYHTAIPPTFAKFHTGYVGVRDGTLLEVNLPGADITITSLSSIGITSDTSPTTIFEGVFDDLPTVYNVQPVTSDGTRYLYLIDTVPAKITVDSDGNQTETNPVNTLWRIELTEMELEDIDDVTYTHGDRVSLQLPAATDAVGAVTYTLQSPQGAGGLVLPRGLSYDTSSRIISGTVADNASLNTVLYTYTAVDAATVTISKQFRITIKLGRPVVTVENGDAEVTLSWEHIPQANDYNIEWGSVDTGSAFVFTNSQRTGNVNSYTITGLNNGERYWCQVTAWSGIMSGPPSSIVTLSPMVTTPVVPGLEVRAGIVSISGIDGEVITEYLLGSGPGNLTYAAGATWATWITLIPTTNQITLILPEYSETGRNSYQLTYTVTSDDADATNNPADGAINVTVLPRGVTPPAPIISDLVLRASVGVSLDWIFTVDNARSNGRYRFTANNLPAGAVATINVPGAYSWPNPQTPTPRRSTWYVTDEHNQQSNTANLTIHVGEIEIEGPATVDLSVNDEITDSDEASWTVLGVQSGNVTWQYTGTLPPGVSISTDSDLTPDGYELTGTPTAVGEYNISISVTATHPNQTVSKDVVINVLAAPVGTIEIRGPSIIRHREGYSLPTGHPRWHVIGVNSGGVTWSVSEGEAPPGTTLRVANTIDIPQLFEMVGTLTRRGRYNFQLHVRATDPPAEDTHDVTVIVEHPTGPGVELVVLNAASVVDIEDGPDRGRKKYSLPIGRDAQLRWMASNLFIGAGVPNTGRPAYGPSYQVRSRNHPGGVGTPFNMIINNGLQQSGQQPHVWSNVLITVRSWSPSTWYNPDGERIEVTNEESRFISHSPEIPGMRKESVSLYHGGYTRYEYRNITRNFETNRILKKYEVRPRIQGGAFVDSDTIVIEWTAPPFEWVSLQDDFDWNVGEPVNTTTLPSARGGTLPYQYRLHIGYVPGLYMGSFTRGPNGERIGRPSSSPIIMRGQVNPRVGWGYFPASYTCEDKAGQLLIQHFIISVSPG